MQSVVARYHESYTAFYVESIRTYDLVVKTSHSELSAMASIPDSAKTLSRSLAILLCTEPVSDVLAF